MNEKLLQKAYSLQRSIEATLNRINEISAAKKTSNNCSSFYILFEDEDGHVRKFDLKSQRDRIIELLEKSEMDHLAELKKQAAEL